VFVAVDEELAREVALKEIQGRYADNPLSRTRFIREAEVTGQLEHPNIVPVYGLGTYPDGRPYYAMRFIKGETLRCAIERLHSDEGLRVDSKKWYLDLRKLLGRFLAVCNAVDYAHSKGVLHRDLKPDNVMLGNYGETYLVDWGLARLVSNQEEAGEGNRKRLLWVSEETQDSDVTRMGEVLGTPAYMSPEQAQGEVNRLGPASDVYSLGATLYHLLTGKAPFEDRDVQVLLGKVCKGEFLPPRQVRPATPEDLESIILKAMALKADDRHASARELADEIERWLADEPLSGYQQTLFSVAPDGTFTSLSPSVERMWGWSRAEMLGKAFAPFIHPEDLPWIMELHNRAIQGETPPILRYRFLTKAGEYLKCETMISLEIREGKVVGIFGITRVVS
jgi:PAS domain S-box-containing protein